MSILRGKNVLVIAGGDPPDGKEALGLGDMMRIITLAPAFEARAVAWCSPPELFPLVRDCRVFSELIPAEARAGQLRDFDSVVNLTFHEVAFAGHMVQVEDVLTASGAATFKESLFDLPGLIAERLRLSSTGHVTVAETEAPPAFDVGFNFRAPEAWKIKELPQRHWKEIERLLPGNLKISWQPEEDSLEGYVDWVKNCRLLVSSVGFGCHVSMFYGRHLIMLSGPTDFLEVHGYDKARVLYPPSICEHRPCHLPTGVDNCGCMPGFQSADIVAAALELLQ